MKGSNFTQWINMIKPFSLPWGELQKTTSELIKQNAEMHLQFTAENYSRITEQLKRLSQVRSPEDFFTLQKDYMNENVSAMIRQGQTMTQQMADNIQTLSQAFSVMCDSTLTTAKRTAEENTETILNETKRHTTHK